MDSRDDGYIHTTKRKIRICGWKYIVLSQCFLWILIYVFVLTSPSAIRSNIAGIFQGGYTYTAVKEHTREKWIIVESSNPLEANLRSLSMYKDWQVLVVTDKDISNSERSPFSEIVFLDPKRQRQSPYKTSKFLSEEGFHRKNLAYLHAIQHGAEWILDIADDNMFNLDPDSFIFDTSVNVMALKASNPIDKFATSVSRGFQNRPSSIKSWKKYFVKNITTPGIQIQLRYDYMFSHLSCGKFERPITRNGNTLLPFVLSPNFLIPIYSSNILVQRKAFWSLFLPFASNHRKADVVRSFFMQRLSMYSNDHMIILPLSGKADDSNKNVSNCIAENSQGFEDWQEFLLEWNCVRKDIFLCITQLVRDMMETGLWTKHAMDFAISWLHDLRTILYKPQEFTNITLVSSTNISFATGDIKGISEIGNHAKSDDQDSSLSPVMMLWKNICPLYSLNQTQINALANLTPKFDDVLLVIVFNHDHTEVIPILESLYRLQFPKIVYVGYVTSLIEAIKYNVSYMPCPKHASHERFPQVQKCLLEVFQMNHEVKGYLVIHDDVNLNFWHFASLDRNKTWLTSDSKYIYAALDLVANKYIDENASLTDKSITWFWYEFNRDRIISSLEEMSDFDEKSVIYKCYNRINQQLNGTYRVFKGQGDLFYLPQRLTKDFSACVTIFMKQCVFFEITFPTVLRCIENIGQNIPLPRAHSEPGGPSVIDKISSLKKDEIWRDYSKMLHLPYFHPFKYGPMLHGDLDRKELFCNVVLPQVIKHM